MTRPLSRQVLLDSTRAALVQDRGIDWYVSPYAVVRADIVKPFAAKEPIEVRPSRLRATLALYTHDAAQPAKAAHGQVSGAGRSLVALRLMRASFVLVDARTWKAWSRREWHAVVVGERGAVRFYELRRGRPVLCGLLMVSMPLGDFCIEPLVGAA